MGAEGGQGGILGLKNYIYITTTLDHLPACTARDTLSPDGNTIDGGYF